MADTFNEIARRTVQRLGATEGATIRPHCVRAHLAATRERALYAGDTSLLVALDVLTAAQAAAAYIDGTIYGA